MDFQDLKYHLEAYGCTLDHMEDNLYFATNCVNGYCCEIEDLPKYSEITLSHYCFECGVPAIDGNEEALERYRHFREHIVKIPLEGIPPEE